jgi:hypothetical protein
VGAPRLEQSPNSSKKSLVETGDDAQNDAQLIELSLIIDRWPTISGATRAKILKLVVAPPK